MKLTPIPEFSDVPQLERTTLALAGPGGPMNEQAQALANRTELLKRKQGANIPTFETPAAGVDQVTGVADGAYFNVRSTDEEAMLFEYQNVGGVATPTGKRYLSSLGVQQQDKPASTIKDASGVSQQKLNNQFLRSPIDMGSVGDGVLRPVSDLYTIGSIAYDGRFSNFAAVQAAMPVVTSPSDPLDWATLQTLFKQALSGGFAISLGSKKYHIGDKTLVVEGSVVCFGVCHLGIGSSLIRYSGNDAAFRFKREPYDPAIPAQSWIYATVFTDMCVQGLGGNAKTAFELWAVSEGFFDRITIGATSTSHFDTAFKLSRCSINTFSKCIGSYNDVMFDFSDTSSISTIHGGDYFLNKTMFKINSLTGLVVDSAWIESCQTVFDFDDTNVDSFLASNITVTKNNILMNREDSGKIIKLKNNVGKPSRVLSAIFSQNVFRYTNDASNTQQAIEFDVASTASTTFHDFKFIDNRYYGKADAVASANSSRCRLSFKDNKNYHASTQLDTILDLTVDSIATVAVESQIGSSRVFGRTGKNRSGATVVIDDQGGAASTLAIYQKTGSFIPLVSLYNSAGATLSSLNVDGSASLTSLNLSTNNIRNTNGTPTSGTFKIGDTVLNSEPSISKPVTLWTCISISPLTWRQSAHIVYSGTTAQRPALQGRDQGVQYFDTTLAANGKPIWWTGSAWVDALGASV